MYMLEYLIYKSRVLNSDFRKLELKIIYDEYSNKFPCKYHKSIWLTQGGGPEFGKIGLKNQHTFKP